MANSVASSNIPVDQFKEISSWVTSVQDVDQTLELIIESATRVMNAKAGSLMLLDPKTNMLYFKVATGEKKDQLKEFRVKLGQGIAGSVAKTGKPLVIPDVNNDPRWFKEISESIKFDTTSIVCVPMKLDSKVIGVVQIIDKKDGTHINEEDINSCLNSRNLERSQFPVPVPLTG